MCAAESSLATRSSATAHIAFRVVVPAVFRILQVTPVDGGQEVRVWTNMRSVHFNNHEYRFAVLGETTLRVPASNDVQIVHGL